MLTLSPAAQALDDSLTADMVAAAAKMDANAGNYGSAYRNAQADWTAARDARHELRLASDPAGMAALAEADRNEVGAACYPNH